jgi:hypothetical protein
MKNRDNSGIVEVVLMVLALLALTCGCKRPEPPVAAKTSVSQPSAIRMPTCRFGNTPVDIGVAVPCACGAEGMTGYSQCTSAGWSPCICTSWPSDDGAFEGIIARNQPESWYAQTAHFFARNPGGDTPGAIVKTGTRGLF